MFELFFYKRINSQTPPFLMKIYWRVYFKFYGLAFKKSQWGAQTANVMFGVEMHTKGWIAGAYGAMSARERVNAFRAIAWRNVNHAVKTVFALSTTFILTFLAGSFQTVTTTAHAQITTCTGTTGFGDNLTIALADDLCGVGLIGTNVDEEILFVNRDGSSVNFDIFSDAGLFADVTLSDDNGAVAIPDVNEHDVDGILCSNGCTVSGTYDGEAFTFTYTQVAGVGSAVVGAGTAATVTVDDVMVAENGGPVSITFTVDNAIAGGFNFTASSADVTAIGGTDFTAISETVTFVGNAGETQTVTFTPTDDNIVEAAETLIISMSGLAGTAETVEISDTAIVTITNDDQAAVTIDDISVAEDTASATVTLTLNNEVDGGFNVNTNTADGTATVADGDYTAVLGNTETFTGTAGETETFTITLGVDTVVEGNETITISMDTLVPTTVAAGDVTISDTGTLTVNNDDQTTLTIDDVTGNEDDGAIALTVTSSNEVDGTFTVNVSTADSTATLTNSDYTAVTNQTLNFTGNAGETQMFTVTPTSDTVLEPDETVNITMSGQTATVVETTDIIVTDTATLTIANDDAAAITIDDVTVNEGDGTATVTLTLDNETADSFSVDVSTANGTATAGDDFTAVTGQTINFTGTAGETADVTIDITDDSDVELSETFTVSMGNLQGTSLTITISDTATVTINDNDAAAVTIDDISLDEGASPATVTLTLNLAVPGGFDVDVSTADGSAVAPGDFTAVTNQTVTFSGNAGETQTVDITIIDDGDVESDDGLPCLSGPCVLLEPAGFVSQRSCCFSIVRQHG